ARRRGRRRCRPPRPRGGRLRGRRDAPRRRAAHCDRHRARPRPRHRPGRRLAGHRHPQRAVPLTGGKPGRRADRRSPPGHHGLHGGRAAALPRLRPSRPARRAAPAAGPDPLRRRRAQLGSGEPARGSRLPRAARRRAPCARHQLGRRPAAGLLGLGGDLAPVAASRAADRRRRPSRRRSPADRLRSAGHPLVARRGRELESHRAAPRRAARLALRGPAAPARRPGHAALLAGRGADLPARRRAGRPARRLRRPRRRALRRPARQPDPPLERRRPQLAHPRRRL
ncbi:MAG: GH74, partial [uncultured Solirubrobacteraceae bacterium]